MALEEAFQVTIDEAQFAPRDDRRRSRGADAGRSRAAGAARRPVSAVAGADRLPVVEPIAAGARRCGAPACRRGSCRSAGSSCARRRRARAPRPAAGPGHLRGEPPEPLRRAGDPRRRCRRAGATAWRRRWRRSSSRRTSSPSSTARTRLVHQRLNYYLAVALLQRVPAAAAGDRHAADAALYWRAGRRAATRS